MSFLTAALPLIGAAAAPIASSFGGLLSKGVDAIGDAIFGRKKTNTNMRSMPQMALPSLPLQTSLQMGQNAGDRFIGKFTKGASSDIFRSILGEIGQVAMPSMNKFGMNAVGAGQQTFNEQMSKVGQFLNRVIPEEKFIRVLPGQRPSEALQNITMPFAQKMGAALQTSIQDLATGNTGLEKAFTGLKSAGADGLSGALSAGKDLARAAIMNLINQ